MNCYIAEIHSHVTLVGTANIDHPLQIVHATKKRVWVQISYADEMPAVAVPVGDGESDGWSDQGLRIISVPMTSCIFLTDDEVELIGELRSVDEKLLSYAR